ncbi:hypothetical protein [uncultured Chryseobacterium sp.]|uniref:hypothetical protein n=1 Tax=uncultured Chryseobacterium sp. TaxID=259322 RepID=UPI00262515A4|nr:hypothetical protein [uncultured Chryseobacterium sp.]
MNTKTNFAFFIALIALIFSENLKAQFTIKRLNDPSIVAQQKRMVFEGWGDWRPYPKYLLGIQTNFAYATVWGMWAPSRNRDYKDGPDIRPLKPTGLETQRFGELELQRKETERIKMETDTIHKRSVQDFAHWTSATVSADPLWLLYYNRMLKPLREFPDNPQNYLEWGFQKPEVYQTLLSTGGISLLKEKLDLLKDKYNISRTVDMPRGKRFLMYHENLIGWRKFSSEIRSHDLKGGVYMDYHKILQDIKNTTNLFGTKNFKTDKEIAQEVMNHYKHQF